MIGSQLVAPIFVIVAVYFGPESPRYLVSRQRYAAAFQSLLRLRATRLQATRDLYYISESVKLEEDLRSGRTFFSDIRDVVHSPRVRYAALASWFIMFMQNFCGINAYVSPKLGAHGYELTFYTTKNDLLHRPGLC
jgi:hypothetical protein